MFRLRVRGLSEYPNGTDEYDTVVNGVHLNLTTLHHFHYDLYSNGTISNNSKCYLAFDDYKPYIFENGTWLNATSCYDPVLSVGVRGSLGVVFAALFGLTIVLTLVNLKNHGALHLAVSKKFSPVGRRWQWYWMLALAACGCISGFMSIDVDRNYLQSMAIMLQSFFFYLMIPMMLAVVWEGVRHWGAWQERQIYDADKFAFDAITTREKQEFYLPLIFYLIALLNILLTVPRSWTATEKQRSPEQTEAIAKPAATDNRFKAAAVLGFLDLITIVYSLGHSIYRYKMHRDSTLMRYCFYPIAAPFKFVLCILIALIRLTYGIITVWGWKYNIVKYDTNPGFLYGFGYAPALLIIMVLNIWGLMEENEDKLLIRQRERIAEYTDNMLGIDRHSAKPVWWRRMRPDYHPSFAHDANGKLRSLVTEVGGVPPAQRRNEQDLGTANAQLARRAEHRRKEERGDYYSSHRMKDNKEMSEHTTAYCAKGSFLTEVTERGSSAKSTVTTANSQAALLAPAETRIWSSTQGSVPSSVAEAQPYRVRSMLYP